MFILPETKIITDGWKAYNTLEQEGYIHVVNHSVEFVNKNDPEINTQKIERLWKSLKNELKREGRAGENDDMYIFQFIDLHQHRNRGNITPQ
jgi:Predicted transcriptional regulators